MTTPEFTLSTAEQLTAGLIAREQTRSGGSQKDAMARVAQRTGVLKSTLEMITRGRLKRLEAWVLARLVETAKADLRAEIRRNEHELELARQCEGYLTPLEAGELEACLAALRRVLDAAPAAVASTAAHTKAAGARPATHAQGRGR